jgi:hypothetical protein
MNAEWYGRQWWYEVQNETENLECCILCMEVISNWGAANPCDQTRCWMQAWTLVLYVLYVSNLLPMLLSDLWLIVDWHWNPKQEIFVRIMLLEVFWCLSLLGAQKLLSEMLRRRKEWLPSCGCVPDEETFIYTAARRKHTLPVTSGMSLRYKIYDIFRARVSVETTMLPSMEI